MCDQISYTCINTDDDCVSLVVYCITLISISPVLKHSRHKEHKSYTEQQNGLKIHTG